MNRVHPLPGTAERDPDADELLERLREACPSLASSEEDLQAELEWMIATYLNASTVARGEDIRREAFEAGLPPDVDTVAVPELERDVHEVAALVQVAARVCAREDV